MRYPIGNPSIGGEEIAAVVKALSEGRLTQGTGVSAFEERFAAMIGSRHAVGTCNGTSALHLALASCGVGMGDEVLVPDLTYVATANAVAYTGADPVLVDVEPSTWNIDLIDAADKVTSRTKAILPVHLYGVPCDADALAGFAENHNLLIVEDAAEALCGHWDGLQCGTYGTCGVFSFYANKIMTTGEGGMVVTDDVELAARLRLLRGQAVDRTKSAFWHGEIGFNYRMTELQAALGLAQLDKLQRLAFERLRVVEQYRHRLAGTITLPDVRGTAPWLFTGLLPQGVSRDRVMKRLEAAGIATRPTFVPMHRLPMYAQDDWEFPIATELSECGISLPTYPELTTEDVDRISDSVIMAVHLD